MVAVVEQVIAKGHPNIRATHPSTIEITKDEWLTPRGDCIIGISANKAVADLSEEFKVVARNSAANIIVRIETDDISDVIIGRGDSRLNFTDNKSIVIRRSDYVCGRTLMIKANKAARDLDRRLIERLRDPNQLIVITITVVLPLG